MEQEKVDKIIISVEDIKKVGLYNPDGTSIGLGVRIQDYKRNLDWNEFDFRKEVFEELLGEDFGKKDFYYEPTTWGFIVDTVEKKIKEVLKTMKKVPQEHLGNPMEYLEEYKSKISDPTTNRILFFEDIKEFLGELYHYNTRKNLGDSKLYHLQLFYKHIKSNYEKGHPLYITVATVEDQNKYP